MCMTCFYRVRHKPSQVEGLLGKPRCPKCDGRQRLHVVLVTDADGNPLYETTYVRKRESVTIWPVKCDPRKFSCEGENCLYAHGDEELKEWKKIFEKDCSSVVGHGESPHACWSLQG